MSEPEIVNLRDGRARIVNGEALAFMASMPDESIDVILMDPPFSSGGRRENSRSLRKSMLRSMEDDEWIVGDSMSTNGFLWTMREIAWQGRRVLRDGGHLFSFIDWRMAPSLSGAIESADLRQHPTIIWDKTYFGMGAMFRNQYEMILHFTRGNPGAPFRRDVGNVIGCKPLRNGLHPTEKPVPLLEKILSVVAGEGSVVLDPFAGSFSCGEAALNVGASFIGVEFSPTFFAAGVSRIEKMEISR